MTPSEYITSQAPDLQPVMRQLQSIIESEISTDTSKMSYGIICYWHHYMLVGIGAKKKGCVSFFTMRNGLLEEMKVELLDIKWSGSTIHIYPDDAMPENLVRRIIRLRMQENDLRISKINRKKYSD